MSPSQPRGSLNVSLSVVAGLYLLASQLTRLPGASDAGAE